LEGDACEAKREALLNHLLGVVTCCRGRALVVAARAVLAADRRNVELAREALTRLVEAARRLDAGDVT
jgi:hypothetical protein